MINKHKIQSYIKITSAFVIGIFAAAIFSLTPLLGGTVEAGGKPDGQGNVVASLCYNAGWKPGDDGSPYQTLGIESTRQGCVQAGFQVIEPGQPLPKGVCFTGNAVQYYGDTGNGTQSRGCESLGGTVIPAGQPMPTYVVADPTGAPTDPTQSGGEINIDPNAQTSGKWCGEPDNETAIDPVIDLGCKGKGNGILDLTFAIVRFLTLGAGLVMVGSTIIAGIQYATSRGDPQATAAALKRITSTVSALLLFVFAYAILNWVVPAGILR